MEEKVLTKFSFHLCLKTLQKMGLEGTYLSIIKAIYGKSVQTSYLVVKS